jgi:hypothetical protein
MTKTQPNTKPFAMLARMFGVTTMTKERRDALMTELATAKPPAPSKPQSSAPAPRAPSPVAQTSESFVASADGIVNAGRVRRAEIQPIATTDLKAIRILAAGELRRGQYVEDIPLPTDPMAKAIVLAARKARGEV